MVLAAAGVAAACTRSPTGPEATPDADPRRATSDLPSEQEETPPLENSFIHVREEGELVWRTAEMFPDYRSAVTSHPTDHRDKIHHISIYNLRFDGSNVPRKDDPGKAGFHLSLESEWERTIEWNLDWTLAHESMVRRAMETRLNIDTGETYWRWHTTDTTRVSFGYRESSLGRWEGTSDNALMRWEVQNHSRVGGASITALNGSGVGGHVYVSAAHAPGTTFGVLPRANLFMVYGTTQTAYGTTADAPVYFFTRSAVRGRISPEGAWVLGRGPASREVGEGDLLLSAGGGVHAAEDGGARSSRRLLGLDGSGRTALGLGGEALALEDASLEPATVSRIAGFIAVRINGTEALVPYHSRTASPPANARAVEGRGGKP